MKTSLALAMLLLLISACSSAPVVRDASTSAQEPAPAQVAGQWRFHVVGKDGVHESVAVLTTEPAETCLSGEWFKAVAVLPGDLAFSRPAYSYSNGRLELLLSSELCDAYTSLVGTVSGNRFSGTHVSYGLFGSTEHGKVTGARQP